MAHNIKHSTPSDQDIDYLSIIIKNIMTKDIYLHTSDLVIKERWIGFLLNTLNVDLVITVTTIGLTL